MSAGAAGSLSKLERALLGDIEASEEQLFDRLRSPSTRCSGAVSTMPVGRPMVASGWKGATWGRIYMLTLIYAS